ncbi:YbhB/YbcL family Raf kinase inhibitor-like protein [Streptococcus sp. DD12]|uniref:YbhB/YbcL family Raf kinase inhibitor-like protein n=1 Tax=Streptococcus sp. DD12 TaxID=1777880 RepID=UPI00079BD46E|nr:YbhB/YbcL family Raf kinase inhibitor-like protein [Streptococcus sp. DD12]KXT76487.1 Phospholipid-binding protein [Streptococcus sp. DD12]
MKITVDFADRVVPQAYAKGAALSQAGLPFLSFPFALHEVHRGAKSLAWTLMDWDAIPVCGFPYIHWVVANVPANQLTIPEDFARQGKAHTRGINSSYSPLWEERPFDLRHGYIGPCPPDKDHRYELKVYALDTLLPLSDDFYLNQLFEAMEGHVLDVAELELIGQA